MSLVGEGAALWYLVEGWGFHVLFFLLAEVN